MADNNILSFIFKVVNQATGPLKEVANSLSSTADRVTVFGEKISIAMTGFQRIAEIGNTINENLSKPIKEFRDSMIDAAAKEESFMISLKAMVGGKEAEKMSEEFEKMAQSMGHPKEELMKIAQAMIPFGARTDDITKTVEILSDVAKGSMNPLSSLTDMYMRIRQQGELSSRQLMQMKNMGIPIYEAMQKMTGKSEDEIEKMATQGKFGIGAFEAAMKMMSEKGGVYFGQTAAHAQSMKGIMARWGETVDNLKEKIGFALMEALGTKEKWEGRIKLLREFGEKLGDFMKHHPGIVKVVSAIGAFLIILGPLVIALGMVAGAIAAISAVGAPIWLAIAAVVVGITGIVLAIMWLRKNWDDLIGGFKKSFGELSTGWKIIAAIIGIAMSPVILTVAAVIGLIKLIQYLIDNWDNVKKAVGGVLDSIVSVYDTVVGFFSGIIDTISEAISSAVDTIMSVIDDVKNKFSEVINWMQSKLPSWLGGSTNVSGSMVNRTETSSTNFNVNEDRKSPEEIIRVIADAARVETYGQPVGVLREANKVKGNIDTNIKIEVDSKGLASVTEATTKQKGDNDGKTDVNIETPGTME